MTLVTAKVHKLKAPYTVEHVKEKIDEAEKLELSIMLVRIFRLMNSYDAQIKHSSMCGEFQANFQLPDSMMGFGILVKTEGVINNGSVMADWKEVVQNVACIHQILVGDYVLPPIGESINWNEYYNGNNSANIMALSDAIGNAELGEVAAGWAAYTDDELPNEIIEFYEDYLT